MPMEPAMPRTEEASAHRGHNVAGWASQPALVPVKILCKRLHLLVKQLHFIPTFHCFLSWTSELQYNLAPLTLVTQ